MSQLSGDLYREESLNLFCDFCGVSANNVYRTVMDGAYNRIRARALYACKECSTKKDNERIKNGLS